MSVSILTGDCRDLLATLDAESVQTCVTSPPYFGLRDYGVAGQIGLEQTPDAFVAELVAVFRDVRRVLKDDGTLWLNLGDSYAGGGTIGRNDTGPDALARRAKKFGTGTGSGSAVGSQGTRPRVADLKPKDLIGIPWRVAFALQADGWYLRSDIIWHKPNPMPESVTDRPTKSHEYLFLLTKSERYVYDADAIAELIADSTANDQRDGNPSGRPDIGFPGQPSRGATKLGNGQLRNRRTVWTVATQPFKGSHFATFPPALIEPCILAGSRRGDTVLDPFGGAGTTGLVADRLGRDATLIELNPAYAKMARARIHDDAPLFGGAA